MENDEGSTVQPKYDVADEATMINYSKTSDKR